MHLPIGRMLQTHGLEDVVEVIMADGLFESEMPVHTLAFNFAALSLGPAAARTRPREVVDCADLRRAVCTHAL